MKPTDALKAEIKQLLVANLMLQVTVEQIGDELPLFGPGGLGLDSVDALQIVVALDKHCGLKIPDPATAKEILQTVSTIARAVGQHRMNQGGAPSAR
jgi:acyl carrier protein